MHSRCGQKASTANFFKTSLRDVTGSIEPSKPRKVKRSRPAVAMAPAVVKPAAIQMAVQPALTGWEQAILNDESLRRGDIVMFSTGPKVFTGATRKAPWTVADFEDLATTKAMANRARDTLLASIGKPAEEAAERRSPDPGRTPRRCRRAAPFSSPGSWSPSRGSSATPSCSPRRPA